MKRLPCTRMENVPDTGMVVTVNEPVLVPDFDGFTMAIAPLVASAGIVTLACVSLTTARPASCPLPTHAALAPVKPLPVTVTTEPIAPEAGEKPLMLGCGYVVVPVVTVNEL